MIAIIIWAIAGFLNLIMRKEITKSDYLIIWGALMASLFLNVK